MTLFYYSGLGYDGARYRSILGVSSPSRTCATRVPQTRCVKLLPVMSARCILNQTHPNRIKMTPKIPKATGSPHAKRCGYNSRTKIWRSE